MLGRRIKGAEGKRGQARDRDIKIRQSTLQIELDQRGRSNLFVDKRIGEYDKVESGSFI